MSEIDAAFRNVDGLLRRASIAEIGGFRLWTATITSRFGGKGIGLPGEQLPTWRGTEMFPLLQIVTSELPYRPRQLDGVAALAVFLDREDFPPDAPHGQGWCIREYPTVDGLIHLPASRSPSPIRSCPIRWHLAERDAPGWDTASSLIDMSAMLDSDVARDRFRKTYHPHRGSDTKVGGWPTEVQAVTLWADQFVFQIGSEEKPGWQWGDAGIAYFMKGDSGEWWFLWDCY